MNLHSIKFRITMLYTIAVTFLFCTVLGGAYAISRQYSESTIKQELVDEMNDFRQVVLEDPNCLENADKMLFFDDHILLSIYNEELQFIDGVLPDELPVGIEFKEGVIQTFYEEESSYFIYDTKIMLENNELIWIRGIHTFNALTILFQRLLVISTILLPTLILLTAIIGYHMIGRSLKSVNMITSTVNEIIDSSDLSLRLKEPLVEDELHALTCTFNQLLYHLEEQFLREKQFTSDAAHELRTPIATILSHCEYCLEELEAEGETREELFIIQKKALHMSKLISSLLSIASAESNKYQPANDLVDLEILAESVIEELYEKADGKNITLELQNELTDPVIYADMEMMMRMFVNLIENGINYGKKHGFVKVFMKEQENCVNIEILDNGIGIEQSHLDKIWNRFYQVDSSRSSEGFGLGLFMVKYIVNCHGGDIRVDSKVEEGTKFTIILPKERT